MITNEITGQIINCAIQVHKALGPGLLESVYKECLYHKLVKSNLYTERERALPVIFEGIRLVEDKIVIEVKSVECLHDIHLAQTLTYLKLGNYRLGLLVNFNVLKMKDGIKRVINGW